MRSVNTAWFCLVIAMAGFLAVEADAQPPKKGGGGGSNYAIVRLQPTADATEVTAADVNNAANVVGTYSSNSSRIAYFYQHSALSGQEYTSLGSDFTPYGLNHHNAIVGQDEQLRLGTYWSSPSASPDLLPPLPGDDVSRGQDLNDAGVIVGFSRLDGVPGASVVAWRVDATGVIRGPVLLPMPDGSVVGVVNGVSEELDGVSIVVGRTSSEPTRGVEWRVGIDGSGSPTVLDSIELPLASEVAGVNRWGDLVGTANTSPGLPFLKYADDDANTLTSLALISKATSGSAYGVNDSQHMVGRNHYLSRGTPVNRAVMWTNPQTVIDLNSRVSLGKSESLTGAYRINSSGDILVNLQVSGSSAGQCLLIAP